MNMNFRKGTFMKAIFISAILFTISANAQLEKYEKIKIEQTNYYIHECWTKSGLFQKETSENGNKNAVCSSKGLLSERPLIREDKPDKILINSANHFCYSKDGKLQTLMGSNFKNTKAACEHAGMFSSISDIENKSGCKEVADSFLEKRGLGTIGKPSGKVRESAFNKDQSTNLPEINLKTKDGDRVTSKAVEKSDMTRWTLTVESGGQIPMFESPPMNFLKINKGFYSRTYNFEIVGEVCVLRSIVSSFLPNGKNESVKDSESLSQSKCQSIIRSYYRELDQMDRGKSSNLSAEDSLKGHICSESIALFNEPQIKNRKIIFKDRSSR